MGMIFDALFGSFDKPDISKLGRGAKRIGNRVVDRVEENINIGKDARNRASYMSDNELKRALKSSASNAEKVGYASEAKKRNNQ